MHKYEDKKRLVRDAVQEKLDYRKEYTDEEVILVIDEVILEDEELLLFSVEKRRQMRKEIFDSLRRLDILQQYVDDSEITEIMVNGPASIFVERHGRLEKIPDQFESEDKLNDVIQQIVSGCNRVVNSSSPIVDGRLNGASNCRIHAILSPVALSGSTLTIRRFPERPILLQDLIHMESISEEAAGFLITLVRAKYNIFVSGGTGSGKTTFLNALSAYIPPDERVITIEDSAELQLQGIKNLVRLETRNSNVEGCKEITIRDLIKASLRMRPDRIIVGEVRGAEAIDMLQCVNTGHDGSMCTGHANSAADMLSRLSTMVLMGMELPLSAIRQQISSGFDIVVHLGRLRDRSRKVLEIAEILGYENDEICINPLYRFIEVNDEICNEDAVDAEFCKGGDKCIEKNISKMDKDTGETREQEKPVVRGRLQKMGTLQHREKLWAAGLGYCSESL